MKGTITKKAKGTSLPHGQAGGQAGRTDGQADGQTDRQTYRQRGETDYTDLALKFFVNVFQHLLLHQPDMRVVDLSLCRELFVRV